MNQADYGLTPAQYHAGVAKLWDALGVEGVQEDGVFTLAANALLGPVYIVIKCGLFDAGTEIIAVSRDKSKAEAVAAAEMNEVEGWKQTHPSNPLTRAQWTNSDYEWVLYIEERQCE